MLLFLFSFPENTAARYRAGLASPAAVNLQRLVLQALFVLPEFLRDTQGYRGKARGCQVVLKVPLSSVHFHSYNFFLPFTLGAGE